jgi:acyl carrier protein
MYGITETTVHVTCKRLSENDLNDNRSLIGGPIPTTNIYVLDSNQKLVPPGVPGELYVGGDGVARGYLRREELTCEKFIANPYDPRECLYRSGDLVRMLENGELEYLGRIDKQIQLRGYRIELGEIEQVLLTLEKIKDAVVRTVESPAGDLFLCAYYVSTVGLDVKTIKEHLARKLPEYMLPHQFIALDSIPLTGNGKIDDARLPVPAFAANAPYAAPQNETEQLMLDIWCDILGVEADKVGIDANFFELGGNSLKVTLLAAKIEHAFDVKIPLVEIFNGPTIRNNARLISTVKWLNEPDQYAALEKEPAI